MQEGKQRPGRHPLRAETVRRMTLSFHGAIGIIGGICRSRKTVSARVRAPSFPVALQPLQLYFERPFLAIDDTDAVADDNVIPQHTAGGRLLRADLIMLDGSSWCWLASSLPRRVRTNPGQDRRSVCQLPAGRRNGC